MVRGVRSVGTLLGFLLAGCSASPTPELGGGSSEEAIVGGQTDTADKGVFGILINQMALCSGSLIAPNLLLTARHCVADLSTGDAPIDCATSNFKAPFPASAFVTTYDGDITDGAPEDSVFGVVEVRVPPDASFCGNDIALLVLDANVLSSAVTLIEPRLSQVPQTNEAFRAVGYGLNNPNDAQGTSAGIRRNNTGSLAVGCVGATECGGAGAEANEWAAYAPVCHGDSGGPALDPQGRVIGVASRADTSCEIGLYSSVANWKDFIIDGAKDAADRGGYEPPTWAGGQPMMDGGVPQAGASAGGSAGTGGSAGKAGSSAVGGRAGGTNGSGGSGAIAGQSNGSGGTTSGQGGRGATAGEAGRSMLPPDAGTPDAGNPMTGPGLGDPCTGTCSGSLLCYSGNGTPPGECVPACSAQNTSCPAHYQCSLKLGACTPSTTTDAGTTSDDDDDTGKKDGGCGCRVTPVSDATAGTWQSIPLLLLVGAVVRRRRRSAAR